MESKAHLLLIDDDQKLAELLRDYLSRYGFSLIHADRPSVGMRALESQKFDLILLDLMLPEKGGLEVCQDIRHKSEIPIIMLTAKGEIADRVLGLEMGADDYLPKPFEPRELAARIDSVLRRSKSGQGLREEGQRDFLGLRLLLQQKRAYLDDQELDLTTMEFDLLALISGAPGKKWSRDELMNQLQGAETELFSRSIDVLVSRLRQKLGETAQRPRFIRTARGSGYIFVAGGER